MKSLLCLILLATVVSASGPTGKDVFVENLLEQLVATTKQIGNSVKALSEELKKVQVTLKSVQSNSHETKKSVQLVLQQIFPASCDDTGQIEGKPSPSTGVRTIILPHSELAQVRCESDGADIMWTVILSRSDGSQPFDKTYEEYSKGFGDPSKEFYIGNEALHEITSSRPHLLRVQLEDFSQQKATAVYHVFRISDRASGYRLTVEKFDNSCKSTGDGLSVHNGMEFSTFDKPSAKDLQSENTFIRGQNCPDSMGGRGGWWYSSCYHALGTGKYRSTQGNQYGGISWWPWHNVKHSLKTFKMMITPISTETKEYGCPF